MASFQAKTIVFMQLSVVLLMATSAFSAAPTSPVKPPVKPPTKPVAVEGVVFCKSCKYSGINTFMGAKPLPGAVLRLICLNITNKPLEAEAMTDETGAFLMTPQNLTNADYQKCKVFLAKSPSEKCDVPTDINSGMKGAMLAPSHNPNPLGPKYALYNVKTFAYEPSKAIPCPR